MGLPPRNSVQITPFGVDFGNVVQSTSSPVVPVVFTARGTVDQNIVINPEDPRFVATPSGNVFCPLNTPVTVNFQFNANATLGSVSALFFSFQGESGYTPDGPTLVANTVTAGSTSWDINPNPFDFGQLRVGTVTSPQVFTIRNNSASGSLTVDTIVSNFPDFVLSGLPTLPVTIPPGGSATFDVACDPLTRGNVSFDNAITITPSVGPAINVSLEYEGFAIAPAFPLLGFSQETLYGLSGIWNSTPTLQLQIGDSTISCEADCILYKCIDFQNPGMNNYINKLFMRTEQQNAVAVKLADNTILNGAAVIKSVFANQGTNTSGIPYWLQFDIEQNGEIHLFALTVSAEAGILIIDMFIITFEPRGPLYELSA